LTPQKYSYSFFSHAASIIDQDQYMETDAVSIFWIPPSTRGILPFHDQLVALRLAYRERYGLDAGDEARLRRTSATRSRSSSSFERSIGAMRLERPLAFSRTSSA
jgi:hypothetical protein